MIVGTRFIPIFGLHPEIRRSEMGRKLPKEKEDNGEMRRWEGNYLTHQRQSQKKKRRHNTREGKIDRWKGNHPIPQQINDNFTEEKIDQWKGKTTTNEEGIRWCYFFCLCRSVKKRTFERVTRLVVIHYSI